MDLHLSPRVLIAEGDAVSRQVSGMIRPDFGGEVDLADDGEEALEKASDKAFDVVFMGCDPPGVDEYAATARIRDREVHQNRHVPIVALTAKIVPGTGEQSLDAGMNDSIAAPFTGDQV